MTDTSSERSLLTKINELEPPKTIECENSNAAPTQNARMTHLYMQPALDQPDYLPQSHTGCTFGVDPRPQRGGT